MNQTRQKGETLQTLKPGTILASDKRHYRIVQTIGCGGFGITYKAVSTVQVGNICAEVTFAIKELYIADLCEREADGSVKVITSGSAENRMAASLSDFMGEAKRLSEIARQNPNIVNVNEVFEANGTAYYVMEFLNGKSLRDHVLSKGSLKENEALKLMTPIIEAVAFLHERQITHLDIKPSNIMLHQVDGKVSPVLIDFGQSRHYDVDGSLTCTLGTSGFSEGYSPLEQYAGLDKFSPTADVYSLAATLMFCLTGEKPARAADVSPEYIKSELSERTSIYVLEAITTAMSRDQNERQNNAAEFLQDLSNDETKVCPKDLEKPGGTGETGGTGGSGESGGAGVSEESEPEPDPKPIAKWIAGAVLLLALVAGAAWLIYGRITSTPTPVPVPVINSEHDVAADSVETIYPDTLVADTIVPNTNAAVNVPAMTDYELHGVLKDANGTAWRVRVVFSTNDEGKFGRVYFANEDTGVVLPMEGSGSNGKYEFKSKQGALNAHMKVRNTGKVWKVNLTTDTDKLSGILL